MLIIFGGLPGSGKSTVSRALAKKLNAVYLRIDSVETAIQHSMLQINQAEDAGYCAAFNIARDNLALGHIVIGDSVNPVEASRSGWRNVATAQSKQYLEVEVICSDPEEHKRRIEYRNTDAHDTTHVVSWEDVIGREYEAWLAPNLTLDTYTIPLEQCASKILQQIKALE